jgi:hypothetical protein
MEMVDDGVPCVLLWDTMEDSRFHYVGFDNYQASYKVTATSWSSATGASPSSAPCIRWSTACASA